MGSVFSAPSAPPPPPPPPPVDPKPVVQPREVVREGTSDKPKPRTRRRAGSGGGGASLTGTILTGGQGVMDGTSPARKSLLGD